jgi:hypothetical protein
MKRLFIEMNILREHWVINDGEGKNFYETAHCCESQKILLVQSSV